MRRLRNGAAVVLIGGLGIVRLAEMLGGQAGGGQAGGGQAGGGQAAGGAATQGAGWMALAGDDLRAAVAGRHLVLAGKEGAATEQFNADGTLLRDLPDAGGGMVAAHGLWRADKARLCTATLPASAWVCARVERGGDGHGLRVTGPDGQAQLWRYDDL